MDVQKIAIDKGRAKELYRDYKKHANYSTPIDDEVRRAYQLMSQGKLVIKALESIRTAGLNEAKLPKLAIVRADAVTCRLRTVHDGGCTFYSVQPTRGRWYLPKAPNLIERFGAGAFPGIDAAKWDYEAVVPMVPISYRPKRGVQNYHILFEAEWTRAVPIDPMLLRRIGKGDMWLVVAAWDLTEVERAALAARIKV